MYNSLKAEFQMAFPPSGEMWLSSLEQNEMINPKCLDAKS